MYFGKRLSGLTEVFNNQNFNRLQSSLSLSILASFCICCYSYLPRPSFNVLSSYFYVPFNLVAVFSVWPLIFSLYKRNWQTRFNSIFHQRFWHLFMHRALILQIKSHSCPQSHLAYFVTDEWPFTLTVFNHVVQVKFSTKLAINLNSIFQRLAFWTT